jgi:hypothetical protein
LIEPDAYESPAIDADRGAGFLHAGYLPSVVDDAT